jgi:NitT/TauT family transport system substrate-binding protein
MRRPVAFLVTKVEEFMKSRLLTIALLALCSASLASPADAQDKKSLIVAEPTHGIGYLPLYVAIRNGYFAKDGIDVKVMTVDGGSTHTNAVLSGQAFAFIGGPEHNAYAKIKGGELRAVVNVVDRGNVYFTARKGSEPKPGQSMPEYFKGKTIAVGLYGGTPNSITRYLLKKWSLDAKADVTMIEMSTSAVLAAVKSGRAVIGVTSEPLLTQGIREGFWSEPIINIPKELGPYAYSTLNVRLASVKSEPELVEKFVRGVVQGLKFVSAKQDEAALIAKKEFPTMAVDDLKATLDRTFADGLWSKDGMVSTESWKTGESVVLAAGILKKPVAYDEIIDMKFVKSSQAANP